MLHHYLIGVGAFVMLSVAWIGVQRAWRKSFPEVGNEPDVLAGRLGCHGCGRAEHCPQRPESEACEAQKEMP
jgi:hypothetical protein